MAKKKKVPAKGGVPESPTCHCLLLVDEVLVGLARHKHILQGIVGVVVVRQFPVRWGGVVVYARISNVYGTQEVDIIIARDGGKGEGIRSKAEMKSEDGPLGICTVASPIPFFSVDGPGRYLLTVEHNGMPLAFMPFEFVGVR